MRLLAYDRDGQPFMAAVRGERLAPLCTVSEFYADVSAAVTAAAEQPASALTIADVCQMPPVPPTAQVLCAGLNYAQHVEEARIDAPGVPDLFARWPTTLTVHGRPVPVPTLDDHFDWEGELAVVIGRPLSGATEEDARTAFLGYTCFNDLSARTFQMATPRWSLGKNADLSGPIGPWIVTTDEIPHPNRLRIRTRVNGEVMQDGSTEHLLFTAAQIASYASGCVTLRPGDVIATGTPDGVGYTRTPPVFLRPGDTVEVEIDRIGTLRTPITTKR